MSLFKNTLKFDLSKISTHRGELMGIAVIAILLCHAPANIPQIPPIVSHILSALGLYGNSTFFFLSGVGLYYSLTNRKYPLSSWYAKRFTRLFLPYFFVLLIVLTIDIVIGKLTIDDAILYLFGISYWKYGNGAWFVWALIPMYLIAPMLKKLFEKNSSLLLLLLLCLLILCINLLDNNSCKYLDSIKQVCSNFPIFIVGIWAGKYIVLNYRADILLILLIHVIFIVFRSLFDMHYISMVSFAVCPSVIIGCYLVRLLNSMKFLFVFLGKVSLESYLFNISLPGLLKLIPIICANVYAPYRYILVVIIGLALSKPIHNFSKKIERVLIRF